MTVEIWTGLITGGLLGFSALAAAKQDKIAHGKSEYDPDVIWKNKWKCLDSFPMDRHTNHWWYFGLYKPDYQERFPFSSTILVWMTDSWHFAQAVSYTSWQLALAINLDGEWHWFFDFLLIKTLFSLIKQMNYK